MDPEFGDERVTSEALCSYHHSLEPINPPAGWQVGSRFGVKKSAAVVIMQRSPKLFVGVLHLYMTCPTGREGLQSLWIVQLQGKEDLMRFALLYCNIAVLYYFIPYHGFF